MTSVFFNVNWKLCDETSLAAANAKMSAGCRKHPAETVSLKGVSLALAFFTARGGKFESPS